MSRVLSALVVCGLAFIGIAGWAGYARAAPDAGPVAAAGGKVQSKTDDGKTKAPARQVPVEPAETDETPDRGGSGPHKPQNEGAAQAAPEPAGAEPTPEDGKKAVDGTAAEPSVEEQDSEPGRNMEKELPSVRDEPAKDTDAAAKTPPSAAREEAAFPGPPLRKPRKLAVRKAGELRPSKKALPPPGAAREVYLCKALQSCRNAFIKCKSKIRFPDQSKDWSIAKEECGARYKACVEKDFQPGEWFFTRWFYFQELKCE